MLTALLSAIEQDDQGVRLASHDLAGRSVLGWQADTAVQLGCRRVVCLCESRDPAIIQLQQRLEAEGVEFHAVKGPLQLAPLIKPKSDLILFRDGLLPDIAAARAIAGESAAVAAMHSVSRDAQPAPEAFERIDRDNFWAGLARVPGSTAAQLGDFPPDSDAISLLLRIALQSGVPTVAIDPNWPATGKWLLMTGSDAVKARETALLDKAMDAASWTAPGLGLAQYLARSLYGAGFPKLLSSGAALGLAILCMAVGLRFLGGFQSAAIFVAAMGLFTLSIWGSSDRLQARLFGKGGAQVWKRWIGPLSEVLLAAVLILPWVSLEQASIVLFTLGLLRIAAFPARDPAQGGSFWNDRVLHTLLIASGAALGQFNLAVIALGLAALANNLLREVAQSANSDLTGRD